MKVIMNELKKFKKNILLATKLYCKLNFEYLSEINLANKNLRYNLKLTSRFFYLLFYFFYALKIKFIC